MALHDWLGLNTAQHSASTFLAASRRSQSSHEAGVPELVLQPGTDGAALELTERQKRLIQLQHPDAARVVVKELHSGASAAALERPSRRVLQTVGLDGSGQPAEPTLTKLDAAAALVEEVARHDGVAKTLGAYAGRILRRPLYLRDPRIAAAGAFSASEHEDADAALVLELPGACWALPEFAGASSGEQIVTPLHRLLRQAVAEGKPSDCAAVDESLDELYAAGGPLRRLASSGAARAERCATAEGGWLAGALEDLRQISAAEVATGLPPELIGGTADAADAAAAAEADAATLRELGELGELLRRLQAPLRP